MPVIDFESAWFSLKAHVATKRSHGASELAEAMARIEVENRLEESQAGYDDRPPVSLHKRSSSPSGDRAASAA